MNHKNKFTPLLLAILIMLLTMGGMYYFTSSALPGNSTNIQIEGVK